jgi:RecJ-like exonuclease
VILIKALTQIGFSFHLRFTGHELTSDYLEKVQMALPRESNVIFVDIGTEWLKMLEYWDMNQIYILDHHSRPQETEFPQSIQLFNPFLLSNDIVSQISSSALCYYIATSISSENTNLPLFAIIGTLGERSTLTGSISRIVQVAKNSEIISNDKAVWFPDRSQSISLVLQRAGLPNLNKREQVEELLKRLNIPLLVKKNSRSFYSLTENENRRLISELTTSYGMDPKEIIKHDYQIINEPVPSLRDARSFARKLNIFGWLRRPDIGLALCLGDREEALRDAISVEEEFNKRIQKELDTATFEEKNQKFKAFYFLDGRSSSMTAPLLAPVINTLGNRRDLLPKPILGCVKIKSGDIMIRAMNSHSLGANFDCQNLVKTMRDFLGIKARPIRSSIGTYGLIVPEGDFSLLIKRTEKYLTENMRS